jgi:outer membrane protein OmpA-like peptidoglycan-associated protein/predicted small lipoprotein YifL
MTAKAALTLLAILSISACGRQGPLPPNEAAPPAQSATAEEVPPSAPEATTPPAVASSEFDINSVPESTASLPPFPFFKVPAGLETLLSENESNIPFDREHMIVGDKVVALEGKVFRDHFALANDARPYTDVEFQRNYSNAIEALGGHEVSRVQFSNEVNDAFGGRDAVDAHFHGTCASDGCTNHTYLIRQNGEEYWILVSSGAIPLQGQIVVLEKEGMKQSLGLLDAATMKKALDADGHVALQVNFDVDKATLHPDANAVIDEITSLLKANPSLRLSIDGHTDNTGSAEHNRTLSGQRAAAVVETLVSKGIDASRLQSQGFGPDKPVADNSTETGRARNRRVELVKLD